MCYPVPCRDCGRITWNGCGAHVAAVKAQVPPEKWCDGHPEGTPKSRSWWRR